jgi:hypothetical protein
LQSGPAQTLWQHAWSLGIWLTCEVNRVLFWQGFDRFIGPRLALRNDGIPIKRSQSPSRAPGPRPEYLSRSSRRRRGEGPGPNREWKSKISWRPMQQVRSEERKNPGRNRCQNGLSQSMKSGGRRYLRDGTQEFKRKLFQPASCRLNG